MTPPDQAPRRLWLFAFVTLALYAVLPGIAAGLSSAEPGFAGEIFGWVKNFSKPSLATLHDSGSHVRASIGFAAVGAGLFGIYFFALKFAREHNDARTQKIIFISGAAFLLVQLLAPVMLSSDVFAYALYGRVTSVYHANPYDLAPPVAPGDPFLKLFGQEYLPSWYGPVWTLVSAGITKLGGEHVGLTVLLFRRVATQAGENQTHARERGKHCREPEQQHGEADVFAAEFRDARRNQSPYRPIPRRQIFLAK